ncbi:MAG: hypothetical protein ACOX0E_02175 [Syntrophomonadaceae bacterium]|jgi:hypothetical protein
MTALLVIFAGVIFLSYSFYFYHIIIGTPWKFESELIRAFGEWLETKAERARKYIQLLVVLSIIFEIVYFMLVFKVIDNSVMLRISAFFAGFEAFHLTRIGINFDRYFKNELALANVFNWRIERISAGLFFNHSLFTVIVVTLF